MQRSRLVAVLLFLIGPALLLAVAQNVPPTAYDLTATIEPAAGTISVRGHVDLQPPAPGVSTIKFNLHETFVVRKLLLDGRETPFSYAQSEGDFIPASRSVVVILPPGLSKDRVRMDIEYDGRLKTLPEFGTTPDWRHALDDKITSQMVELANYSSWYPQFPSRALDVHLALSLPQGWIAICSGKKLSEGIEQGRAVSHWNSPNDDDIVILASPNYKKKSIQEGGLKVEIYHTRMPEAFISQEGAQIAGVLKLYSSHLGEPVIPGGIVKHVYSPKLKG